MRLNACRFSLAMGIVWGLGMAVMAWGAWLSGWALPMVQMMGSAYIGYQPTFVGGLVGFLWGFVDFAIFGYLVAWIYNGCKTKCCGCGCVNCNCGSSCKCCSTSK